MNPEQFEEVKKNYIGIVKGQKLSTTWPNHTIYDIILSIRDGVFVPHVVGRNENNSNDHEYSKPLDSWLNDNFYKNTN